MTKLLQACLVRNWNANDLAYKLGTTPGVAAHMLETGIVGPEHILRLVDIFNMKASDLIGY